MIQKTEVSLENLHFDPQNPRIPLNSFDPHNEQNVIEYMVRNGNIVELMQSIGETGFSVAEPLLVVPVNTSYKDFIVVEGNRRLAALKLLSNPELTSLRKKVIAEVVSSAKNIPTEIPVIIYHSRDDILDYLGYRHITGVKDWGPLEKARYLDQLYSRHIESVGPDQIYSTLAKMIGSRTDYVGRLHTALKLYEKANDEAYYGAEINENDFNFSWLTTALSYNKTYEFIGLESASDSSLSNLNEENYSTLFTWLFDPKEKKVLDSREISDLNTILESKPAIEKLKKGSSITEALLFTSAPNKTFRDLILAAKNNLQSSKNMIEQLRGFPEETVQLIEDIEKICKSIKGALSGNFSDSINGVEKQLTEEQLKKLLSLIEKQGE